VKSIPVTIEKLDVLYLSSEMYLKRISFTNSSQIRKMKRAMYRAIENDLTSRQQEIVVMYYFRGMTMSKIAGKLNVNKSTVSRTLKRAKKRLKNSGRIKSYPQSA